MVCISDVTGFCPCADCETNRLKSFVYGMSGDDSSGGTTGAPDHTEFDPYRPSDYDPTCALRNVNPKYGSELANNYRNPRQIKLEAAKQWLRERNGGHPGCLERFANRKGPMV